MLSFRALLLCFSARPIWNDRIDHLVNLIANLLSLKLFLYNFSCRLFWFVLLLPQIIFLRLNLPHWHMTPFPPHRFLLHKGLHLLTPNRLPHLENSLLLIFILLIRLPCPIHKGLPQLFNVPKNLLLTKHLLLILQHPNRLVLLLKVLIALHLLLPRLGHLLR